MSDAKPVLIEAITLEQLKKEITADTVIYYSVGTPWWTHRAEDLCRGPKHEVQFSTKGGHSWTADVGRVPHDPTGSPLYMTNEGDAHKFIEMAEDCPSHYGKHTLKAFMSAHAMNCRLDDHSWALRSWKEYNELLDKQGASHD